jgi:hypothetical protein
VALVKSVSPVTKRTSSIIKFIFGMVRILKSPKEILY